VLVGALRGPQTVPASGAHERASSRRVRQGAARQGRAARPSPRRVLRVSRSGCGAFPACAKRSIGRCSKHLRPTPRRHRCHATDSSHHWPEAPSSTPWRSARWSSSRAAGARTSIRTPRLSRLVARDGDHVIGGVPARNSMAVRMGELGSLLVVPVSWRSHMRWPFTRGGALALPRVRD